MNTADVEAAAEQIWRSGKKPSVASIAANLGVSAVELVERFRGESPEDDSAPSAAPISESEALDIDWQDLIWGPDDVDEDTNGSCDRARMQPANRLTGAPIYRSWLSTTRRTVGSMGHVGPTLSGT